MKDSSRYLSRFFYNAERILYETKLTKGRANG
jgi:hypothetical protein